LLTDALQKLPHSTLLRTLRADLEQQRAHQVRLNERDMLLTRAGFLLEQRELYQQQMKLQSPSFLQDREYTRQQAEAQEIAASLMDHADYALQHDDKVTAKNVLSYLCSWTPLTGQRACSLTCRSRSRSRNRLPCYLKAGCRPQTGEEPPGQSPR
jgi:hypothetical protein